MKLLFLFIKDTLKLIKSDKDIYVAKNIYFK